MKHAVLTLALAAALLGGPALAQAPAASVDPAAGPLPTDPGPRAAACTAILSAVSGTVRPSSADMANELDELARRWRTKAEGVYREMGQSPLGEQLISDQSMALVGKQGLPGGTFDKAATCQVEGARLPPA